MSQETKDKLKELIKEPATDDGASCENSWQIADELALPKQEFVKAADDVGIKIHSCQPGCF